MYVTQISHGRRGSHEYWCRDRCDSLKGSFTYTNWQQTKILLLVTKQIIGTLLA